MSELEETKEELTDPLAEAALAAASAAAKAVVAKKKKGPNFKAPEDLELCKAFVGASEDTYDRGQQHERFCVQKESVFYCLFAPCYQDRNFTKIVSAAKQHQWVRVVVLDDASMGVGLIGWPDIEFQGLQHRHLRQQDGGLHLLVVYCYLDCFECHKQLCGCVWPAGRLTTVAL